MVFQFLRNTRDKEMQHDLAGIFRQGVESTSRFDGMMSGIVTSVIDGFIVPWFIKCLQKYSESDFHTRLSGTFCSPHNTIHSQKGSPHFNAVDNSCIPFSFIVDFHLNHKTGYAFLLKQVGLVKQWYSFDVGRMHRNLIHYLTNVRGWTIHQHESDQILRELGQIRNMIFTGAYD